MLSGNSFSQTRSLSRGATRGTAYNEYSHRWCSSCSHSLYNFVINCAPWALESRARRSGAARVVPDDGVPPQRCSCCPCRGAEKAWLGAIRPFDSVARPRDRRSVVGVGSKGALVGCGHELRRRRRRLGGRSWAARRAVFGRFLVAALPLQGFLSRSKVRPATSTQVLPVERC